MDDVKRIRIFAGPNGSGKTTIINQLKESKNTFFFGVYVNADDIESELRKTNSLNFAQFSITPSLDQLQDFFQKSTFSKEKVPSEIVSFFFIEENILYLKNGININSYLAAHIADFTRQQLLQKGMSFTFETVMSHQSKLVFLKKAKDLGYRIYLYYIATEDPDININRVSIRIAQHGHVVSPEIIKSRYYRSLENLKEAVLLTNRAFIFDNSLIATLIAEVTEGNEVQIIDEENTPRWFIKYLAI